MNLNYFRNLDYAEKLWHVVANANATTFAYKRLEVHRESATVQMTRIWDAVARSHVGSGEPQQGATQEEIKAYFDASGKRMIPILYEVHFYFVAWTDCGHMLRAITGQPELLEAKKVFDSFKKPFEDYTEARNTFEHYDDRLPSQPQESRVKEIKDLNAGPRRVYFGFSGTHYKHSDKAWDISPSSLELLNRAISDVIAVVHRTVDELIESKFSAA